VYLVNYLNLQTAQQLFIAVGRYRTGCGLVGIQDGVNRIFTLPSGEKFAHNLPYLTVSVYVNGLRQVLVDDYTISESGGVGSGYDTVTLISAPYLDDHLTSDYVLA
jgi:hypothetical protein